MKRIIEALVIMKSIIIASQSPTVSFGVRTIHDINDLSWHTKMTSSLKGLSNHHEPTTHTFYDIGEQWLDTTPICTWCSKNYAHSTITVNFIRTMFVVHHVYYMYATYYNGPDIEWRTDLSEAIFTYSQPQCTTDYTLCISSHAVLY